MTTREVVVGTAGHIDHGKTSLVKALTGIDTDRLEEERERGISIELGFAHLDLDGMRLGIVDVPGHERFLRNMLAGAAGVDAAILVVAADDSVMPQTREHLEILKFLDVRRGVIALTKADLVDPDWLALVEQDVRELVADSFLADAPIVATSTADGRGLDDLRAALAEQCRVIEQDRATGPFRLAIDRSFALAGLGTVVTGTVASGRITAADEVECLPGARRARIRGLQSHGRSVESVERGQRAAINLTGVHHTEIERGHVLATPGSLEPSRRLTVHIRLLPGTPWPLRHRARVRCHVGTQEVIARVWLLESNAMEAGQDAMAQLQCAEFVAAVNGQPFVLRTESPVVTIGGGRVLQPIARRLRRRDGDAIGRLRGLLDPDDRVRAETALALSRDTTVDTGILWRDAGVDPERAQAVIDAMLADGTLIDLRPGASPPRRLHRVVFEEMRSIVEGTCERLHAEQPLATRFGRQSILAGLRRYGETTSGAVIDRLLADGVLVGDEGSLFLASHQPKLSKSQQRLKTGLVELLNEAAFRPPPLGVMAKTLGTAEADLRRLATVTVKLGEIVHLGGDLYLHANWHEELRRRIGDHLREHGGQTVSQLRDVLDTSRKYAVPICEHLDRIGLTKRQGDLRVLAS